MHLKSKKKKEKECSFKLPVFTKHGHTFFGEWLYFQKGLYVTHT